jgi:hypothetical protein
MAIPWKKPYRSIFWGGRSFLLAIHEESSESRRRQFARPPGETDRDGVSNLLGSRRV